MRSALAGALLCWLWSTAAAQEQAVTFDDEPTSATLTGFAVADGLWDRNTKESTILAGKLAVSLFRPWSDYLYFFGQLTTHLGIDEVTGEEHTEIEIDNLIVSWSPPGATAVNLSVGRFDAPIGFERDDEPLNLLPTPSFNFELARPSKLSGAVFRWTAGPTLGLTAFVANGWNLPVDNNTGKTAGLRLQWLPRDGYAIGVNTVYGPEEEGTNDPKRTLFSGDATLQPMSAVILGLEVNYGRQTEGGASTTWTGGVGTGFLRLGRNLGVAVRGEVLDDPDGFTTGQAQTLTSLTIAPMYFYREAQEGIFSTIEHTTFRLPAFSLRPAIRFDWSNAPSFEDADGALQRSNVTGIIELVYLF